MKKMNGRLAALEKDAKQVKSTVNKLKIHQETTDGVLTEVRSTVSEVRQFVAGISNAVSAEVSAEMKDCEDRKHNILLIGMKESTAAEKAEVLAEENGFLGQMFQDMGMDPADTSTNIKFKARLGHKELGKPPRPFLLKFRSVNVRDKVLQNAKKIKDSSSIRIKPDLTKKEREEDEKFKKAIDEENKTEPKDEMGDFRWKLAGPPGNLRKIKERDIPKWEESQRARAALQQE